MNKDVTSLSIASPEPIGLNGIQRLSIAMGFTGLFILLLALLNINFPFKAWWLAASIGLVLSGIIIYSNSLYKNLSPGIKNNGVFFKSISARGIWAWGLGIILTLLYIFLYWFPQYLGIGKDGAPNT